jgi:hypothetical protein
MTLTINLAVPPQRKPGPGTFDARPEKVREWLARLPRGDTGETTRQLYLILHEVNRLDIELHHRLQFLEQVAVPLQGVLAALRPYYSGKPLPLESKTLRVAQLATDLMGAMIVGYQLVLQGSDARHWFRQNKWEAVWTTALHRLLHYFNAVFAIYHLLHLPPPAGAWLMIHSAYRLLEDNGLLGKAVPPIGGEGEATTLEHEYKQLLLLALLPPQRTPAAQMAEVRHYMREWTAALQLLAPAREEECNGVYCLDLDQDAAPGPLWKLHPEQVPNLHSLRRLHMAPLLDALARQLQQNRAAAARIVLPSGTTVQRDTAALLVNCWLRPPERSDMRERASGTVHAVFGLREIHALLSGVAAPAADEAAAEIAAGKACAVPLNIVAADRDRKPRLPRDVGFVSEREENADVWDRLYTYRPQERPRAWSEMPVTKDYRLISGEQVDRSAGGLGMHFVARQLGVVKDGELVVFSVADAAAEWSLGMVRWLRVDTGGGIELGVKRLQEQVIPATICVEQGSSRSAPIDCLLGQEQDELRIVLPQITGLSSKRLLLQSGGDETHITLLEQLEASSVFQMFRCVEPQERHDAAAAKAQPEDPFDKYKSIWEIL